MVPRTTKKQATTTEKQTTTTQKSTPSKKTQKKTPTLQDDAIIELPTWEGPKKPGVFKRFWLKKETPSIPLRAEEIQEIREELANPVREEEGAPQVSEEISEEVVKTPEEEHTEKIQKVDEALSWWERKQLKQEDIEPVIHLVNAIESLGLQEFIEYIRSPWRLLWPNFVAGVARGFGALVGATIVVALVIWWLTQLVGIPFIGSYIEPLASTVETELQKYIESTNYNSHFVSIEESLDAIHTTLGWENNTPTGSWSQ